MDPALRSCPVRQPNTDHCPLISMPFPTSELTSCVTSITSVPDSWHGCALFALMSIAIVPIEVHVVPPLQVIEGRTGGYLMRMMHLCYAAIGFAVARWIFRRQAVPVVDPVTRFRSQGLL